MGAIEPLGLFSGSDLSAEPFQGDADPETGEVPDPKLYPVFPTYTFGYWIPIKPRLDAGIRVQPLAPTQLRAKYQFTGEPETRAEADNLSASGLASLGFLLGGGATMFAGDLAVALGYRLGKPHLLSAQPYFGFGSLSVSGDAESGGSFSQFGLAAGYQYELEAMYLRAELNVSSGSFGKSKLGGLLGGLLLGFRI